MKGFLALGDTQLDNQPMTAISCVAIGVAFLLAVVLLIFAGVVLGWVIPSILERSRAAKGDPPRRTD